MSYEQAKEKYAKIGVDTEAAIKKLDGVKDATVSFMTQKMTLEADDDKFDDVVKAAVKCIAKVEPDCRVIPTPAMQFSTMRTAAG